MNAQELEPAAQSLIDAYFETHTINERFTNDFEGPLNRMAQAQVLRSVAQRLILQRGTYLLSPEWADFGRIQFTDPNTNLTYLVRSASAVLIEKAMTQATLLNPDLYLESAVIMVVTRFKHESLELALAGTRRKRNTRRIEISGDATILGNWPLVPSNIETFDQGVADAAWAALGNPALQEGETGT